MLEERIHASEQAWVELQQQRIGDFGEINHLHNASYVPVVVGVDLHFRAEGVEAKDVGYTMLGSLYVSHACEVYTWAARTNGIR